MRGTALGLKVSVAGLALGGLALLAPAGAQVSKPSLDVVDSRPLVVRGKGFKANERVVVLALSANRRWARTTQASEVGAFTARFPVAMPRCRGFALHALGSRGSRARHLSRLHVYCRPDLLDQPELDPTK
jgi:hypothetical protein